jgi:uncharacterized membrane protein YqjE
LTLRLHHWATFKRNPTMTIRLVLLLAVIAAFGALTVMALLDVGYLGIILPNFQALGPGQVFADLVILAVLSCVWMVYDQRSSGVPALPFILITLAAGSFGILFYLVARELKSPAR